MKYLLDFPPTFMTTTIMIQIINNETAVNGMDKRIMEMNEETIVIEDDITFGIVCEMTCLIVSTSFVYTDMISPCACVSK